MRDSREWFNVSGSPSTHQAYRNAEAVVVADGHLAIMLPSNLYQFPSSEEANRGKGEVGDVDDLLGVRSGIF